MSKTCTCESAKDDHELINNKCDICKKPINAPDNEWMPTMELRWLYDDHLPWDTIKALQQKRIDNQGNFKWVDVPTVKEE